MCDNILQPGNSYGVKSDNSFKVVLVRKDEPVRDVIHCCGYGFKLDPSSWNYPDKNTLYEFYMLFQSKKLPGSNSIVISDEHGNFRYSKAILDGVTFDLTDPTSRRLFTNNMKVNVLMRSF